MVSLSKLLERAKNKGLLTDLNSLDFAEASQSVQQSSIWSASFSDALSCTLWDTFNQQTGATLLLTNNFNNFSLVASPMQDHAWAFLDMANAPSVSLPSQFNNCVNLGSTASAAQSLVSIIITMITDQITTSAVAASTPTLPNTTVANSAKLQADPTIKSFSIADTAANIIGGIGTLLSESKLSAITLTDKIKPTFSLTNAAFNIDMPILTKISSAFNLLVNGATVASASSLQSNTKVTSFTIIDTAANIQSNLSSLSGVSHLIGITISDAKLVNMTYQQFLSYASLENILGAGVLSVSGVAAGVAILVGQNAHVNTEAVADTLSNIVANLDNLETLAKAGKISNIAVTDIGQTVDVTTTQFAADHDAIALMTGNFKINQITSSGLKINLVWDTNAQAAPQAFRSAVQSAANILQQTFSNNITLNFNIGYGEVAGQKLTNGSAAAGPAYGNYISIGALKNTLLSSSTSKDDQQAYAGLSTTLNPNGNGSVAVWSAEEKALGLISGTASNIDGYVGFATDVPSADLVGVALHELTHAMGRTSGYGPYGIEDLFRYSAAGVHSFSGGVGASYLSLDNGLTHLADFATSSDYGDFSNSSPLTREDAFNAFYDAGTLQTLSTTDIRAMDVLGFTQAIASVASAGTPQGTIIATPTAVSANAFGQLLVGSIS